MPIYEYYCKPCHEIFESLIMPLETQYGGTLCPECRTVGAERVMSIPAHYTINGDNSSSTPPKSRDTGAKNRQLAKRERVDGICKRQGVDLGYDKAGE